MCFLIGFALLLIAGGASVATKGDVPIGVITILMGVFILNTCLDMAFGDHRIDSSVKNKIVAHDGNGRYLVQAKTSRQITGPRPHVTGNLPASLSHVKKGLWVVDSTGYEHDYSHVEWREMDGNYHVEPRGNTETKGFLGDVMEGWEHNYIQEDKQ